MALLLHSPANGPHTTGTDESLRTALPVSTSRPRVASTDILRGNAEVEIDHRGTLYRLRVTSLGKLILTK
ncbi:MAG: hemin uptake protein HemP [Burkholderiaceae bacterium]|nr:hemin uptake protein HemP [Burkholderiaceae bacterium]